MSSSLAVFAMVFTMPRQKLFLEDAEIARDRITREEMRRIEGLYEDWAKEIEERARYYQRRGDSFQERYYRELKKQLEDSGKAVSRALYTDIKSAMFDVSDSVMASSAQWMRDLGFKGKSVSAAMSSVARREVTNIINGRIYDSGWSLSARIWGNNNELMKTLYQIVGGGYARNEGVYEIALELAQYVNPKAARQWNLKMADGRKIYPKQVDYNAQRLARTLIQHAYQQSVIDVCKHNPWVQKIRWVANGSRVCEICADRDGTIYDIDQVPLDHPNGMCVMEPIVDATEDEMNERLAAWVHGAMDDELDDAASWYGFTYGEE